MTQNSPPINYQEQLDSLDARAAAVSSRVDSGQASPREVTIKVNPEVSQFVQNMRSAGGSVPLNADGTLKAKPSVDEAVQVPPIPAAAPVANPNIPQIQVAAPNAEPAVQARELSDEEIIRKVQPFLDATIMRPVFVSEPILRKVYVATYPSYVEMLAAERMLGPKPRTPEGDVEVEYLALSEIGAAVKGFLWENDPNILKIRLHPGDVTKWPTLNQADFLTALHPQMRGTIIPALTEQYWTWKISVTPTNDEMEKFYGLMK